MKLIPFFLALSILSTSIAQQVTKTELNKAVANFMGTKASHTKNGTLQLPNSINQKIGEQVDLVNFIPLGEKGFVIVSGNKNAPPILGYSYDSKLDTSSFPPGLNSLLKGYKASIKHIVKSELTNDVNIAKWDNLLNSNYLAKTSSQNSVDPLITTKWGQEWPYNTMCPDNTPTGCTATAIAQILKYWNSQVWGTGYHEYYHEVYGTLSADFGNTPYDWSNMPNEVTSENGDVAKLMYHCGIAVEASYHPGLTSAYPLVYEGALISFFNIAASATLLDKNDGTYSADEWKTLIKYELDNLRPVLYSGGNHAWICDGYDGDFFHMNWGWNGVDDGYFLIDDLTPFVYNFNDYNKIIVGIMPNDGSTINENTTLNGDIILDYSHFAIAKNINLTLTPGTKLKFGENCKVKIFGNVYAVGNETDSIWFTSINSNEFWGGADFTNFFAGQREGFESIFKYTIFENSRKRNDIYSVNPDYRGGAINCEQAGELVISHSRFSNNHAFMGGAISLAHQTTLQNCYFLNNTGIKGGAIFINGTEQPPIEIWSCTFIGNHNENYGGSGGAIYVESGREVSIKNSYFEANKLSVIDNYGTFGGAIFSIGSNVKIFNNVFYDNFAASGGALRIRSNSNNSTAVIANNLIYDNRATSDAGAIALVFGIYAEVYNNTIMNNINNNTGGGAILVAENNASAKFRNNIIYGNAPLDGVLPLQIRFYESGTLDIDYNCIMEGKYGVLEYGGTYTDIGEHNIDIDPNIQSSTNSDYRLTSASPCINAGTPDTTGLALPLADLDGNVRIWNGRIDMGAFEFGSQPLYLELPNVKIFLEGPYSNGDLNTNLSQISNSQPFSESPWNYNGSESVSNIPSGTVDWVLIELREERNTPSNKRRAAFVNQEGIIVDTNGSNKVKFENINSGDYYVVIYHRNHLPIMSSQNIKIE